MQGPEMAKRGTLFRLSAFQKNSRPKRIDELAQGGPQVVAFRWSVARHRHDADRSESGKSEGTCTGLGQINATAFNIRPSVRDRDRDGMTILLVDDLDFGTEGQRFVRRRHGVIVERDAAGSFGSRLRRVTYGVHRCDAVFGTNWNVEQTKYKRGDQPSHA